jgi:glycosyltransferase involved in cell wall biosynthesis
MISVCIPVYNFDINPLVDALHDEINAFQLACEIVLIDDCSEENYKIINRAATSKAKYIQLTENIGRSKIRNLFLKYATNDYLLFLDCDSLIIAKDFLRNYLHEIEKKSKIVCGGRVYPTSRPEKDKLLRWKYGVKKESKIALERKKFPNKSFMTNNFLIARNVLEEIQFEERLTEYGHEDTLFGLALKNAGITIEHIENPILNGDIETNQIFLEKTKKAIDNLVLLNQLYENPEQLSDEIQLLKTAKNLKFMHGIIRLYHTMFARLTAFFLTKGIVNLRCFNLYKLGYFLTESKKVSH